MVLDEIGILEGLIHTDEDGKKVCTDRMTSPGDSDHFRSIVTISKAGLCENPAFVANVEPLLDAVLVANRLNSDISLGEVLIDIFIAFGLHCLRLDESRLGVG